MKIKSFLVLILVTLSVAIYAKDAKAILCATGDKAEVKWNGSWYPARVIATKDNKCKIHYVDYGSSWDEWVGPDRIRVLGRTIPTPKMSSTLGFEVGNAVQVLWGGKWWPARVIGIRGDKLKINYDGYGSSWDEWVGPDRYRKP